jgi:hypothetical protein
MNPILTESEFDELQFATCPTETKEPFFWKWNDHGKEILLAFIHSREKIAYEAGKKEEATRSANARDEN